MKIIINASDIHCGGGKIMLNDLLDAALQRKEINFFIFVDKRYDKTSYLAENINFIEVSIRGRFSVDSRIKKLVEQSDIVLYIGDLPPFKRHNCQVTQLLMNRYFIDNFSTGGMPLIDRIRLTIERLAFKIFLKNADQLVVQNLVMKDLLLKIGYSNDIISVLPYKKIDILIESDLKKEKNSFIYVASGEPHKNHKNLISAWIYLKNEGINPLLFLTLDDNTELYNFIMDQIKKYDLNIEIKSKLPREELLRYYQKVSALIYPSVFECFGLPLVEAGRFELPVVASESDYIRDLLDPDETFDPESPRSIARAVKRFLGYTEKRYNVISPDNFIGKLINNAKQIQKHQ
ncbi:glycosyltransferase [Bacteroidota bacterium]